MNKPSDFCKHPFNSVFENWETEQIARNIMVMLKRTGDIFRKLSFEEYTAERVKDGAHPHALGRKNTTLRECISLL